MPAVVLLGPRQVSKTTLARTIASEWGDQALYLDLERETDRRRLDDADAYLRAQAGSSPTSEPAFPCGARRATEPPTGIAPHRHRRPTAPEPHAHVSGPAARQSVRRRSVVAS